MPQINTFSINVYLKIAKIKKAIIARMKMPKIAGPYCNKKIVDIYCLLRKY
jgi:hypothetical protein